MADVQSGVMHASHHSSAHRILWVSGAVVLLHIASAMYICTHNDKKDAEAIKHSNVVKNRRKAACGSAIVAAVIAFAYVVECTKRAGCCANSLLGSDQFNEFFTLYLHRPNASRKGSRDGCVYVEAS